MTGLVLISCLNVQTEHRAFMPNIKITLAWSLSKSHIIAMIQSESAQVMRTELLQSGML